MSKAEEIAYEVYPAHSTTSVLSSAQVDLMRIGFIKGYEQAEKDTMEWVRHYILSHDTVDIFQMEDAFNDEWRNKK